MSQHDKKKWLAKKILETLEKYGALNTENLTIRVNKNYSRHFSQKTIQRAVKELKTNGRIRANPSAGRGQTYSVNEKNVLVSPFFIDQCWKTLDLIRRKNIEDSINAFLDLRSFIKMLPAPIPEGLEPDITKTKKVLNEWIEKNQPGLLKSLLLGLDSEKGFRMYLRSSREVEDLIGKVSNSFHELFQKTQMEANRLA